MEIAAWHIYVTVGILFIIAEIFIPGFIMAPIGIAALMTAVFSLFVSSVSVQLFVLGAASILVFFLLAPVVKRFMGRGRESAAIGLSGQIGTLVKRPDGPQHPGYVKVYGDKWEVLWDASDAVYTELLRGISEGAQVKVVAVEGNRVRIEKV